MAPPDPARPRGRRVTLEISDVLYARLMLVKARTRKSLIALGAEALAAFVDAALPAKPSKADRAPLKPEE